MDIRDRDIECLEAELENLQEQYAEDRMEVALFGDGPCGAGERAFLTTAGRVAGEIARRRALERGPAVVAPAVDEDDVPF